MLILLLSKYEQHYDKKYGVDLKAEKESVVIPYENDKEQEKPKEEKKPKPSGKTMSMEM